MTITRPVSVVADVVSDVEGARKVVFYECCWCSRRRTNDNGDALLIEEPLCARPQAASNHHVSVSLSEPSWEQSRFVRRSLDVSNSDYDLCFSVDVDKRKSFAVAKMLT